MKKHAVLMFAVAVVGLAPVLPGAAQTNRYVAQGGSSTPPYDTWDRAGTSLASVVHYANAFKEGDTVYVSNGTYVLTNTATVSHTVVRGAGADRTAVVIDGAGSYQCFNLAHLNALVADLTVSNGYKASSGGGVYIKLGTLSNCAVLNCSASNLYGIGGGIYVQTGTVANCLISGNTLLYGTGGGGICVYNSGLVSNCTIVNNVSQDTAEHGGGGAYIVGNGIIDGCVITGNVANMMAGGLRIGENGVAQNCLISGNSTLRVVSASDVYFGGGGVAFNRGGIVSNCLITANHSTAFGGGVYMYRGGTLRNSRVIANIALTNGGGIILRHDLYVGNIRVENCIVTGNTAGVNGGGVWNCGGAGIMRNCAIVGNTAGSQGGGWYTWYYGGEIYNCTMSGNSAPIGGGLYYRNGYFANINSIIYGNVGGASSNWYPNGGGTRIFTNCCTAPLTGLPGSNNSETDPLFADPGASNYRLHKDSPFINAGVLADWMTNAVDVEGYPRIRGRGVDLGAYEWFPRGAVIMFQ